ncbi:MAG TPA: cytochrome c oxidase subunit 3 family protein [Acidobacteriota bacterium]
MAESATALAHQFDDLEQQREAGYLGMWTFLVTEILFFGGIFTGYTAYRALYPEAFAIGSHHLDYWLGTINTAVLILSSLTMALAVHASQLGRRRPLAGFLIATMVLGAAFLGVKWFEYAHKFQTGWIPGPDFAYTGPHAPQVELFVSFYFALTGMHALHMVVGLGILTVLLVQAWHGKFSPEYHSPVVVSGLYWHFVDIVWIFLYPLLYLIGAHH